MYVSVCASHKGRDEVERPIALCQMKHSGDGAVTAPVGFSAQRRLGGVPRRCVSITHVPFFRSLH
jgi:hypothetical protein